MDYERARHQKLKWARLAADRLACEAICRFLLAMTQDGEPFRHRRFQVVR